MVGSQELGWEMEGGSRAVMLGPWSQQMVQGWVGETLVIMMISLDRGMELHKLDWMEILVKD